jgi:hypothetical protein
LPTNLSLYFRVHFKEYFLNGAPLGSVGSSLAKVRRKLNPTPVKKTARKSRRANQENNNPTIPVQNLPRPSSSAQNGLTDYFFCIMCQESFSESRPGEKWVQCVKCLL